MSGEQSVQSVDFAKGEGLVPVIVQDTDTAQVLMLGYMNAAALEQTLASGRVTFFSRSKQRLWTKGESSGDYLSLVSWQLDCDQDTILILARPAGPTCHTGSTTCWGEWTGPALSFVGRLERLIGERERLRPEGSYTTRLFESGIRKIAQKVGEEGVEVALAAVAQDDAELLNETADLLFHTLVALRARGLSIEQVANILAQRHSESK